MADKGFLCPKCNKDDMVRKVSSIFSEGVTKGTYSGPTGIVGKDLGSDSRFVGVGYTSLEGYSQSAMSARLAPPLKPVAKKYHPLLVIIGILMAIGGCGVLPMAGIGGLLGASTGSEEGAIFGVCTSLPILILSAIMLGIAYLIYNAKRNHDKKEQARVNAAVPAWQEAYNNWNTLYFCARDDIVFRPGGEYVDTEHPQRMILPNIGGIVEAVSSFEDGVTVSNEGLSDHIHFPKSDIEIRECKNCEAINRNTSWNCFYCGSALSIETISRVDDITEQFFELIEQYMHINDQQKIKVLDEISSLDCSMKEIRRFLGWVIDNESSKSVISAARTNIEQLGVKTDSRFQSSQKYKNSGSNKGKNEANPPEMVMTQPDKLLNQEEPKDRTGVGPQSGGTTIFCLHCGEKISIISKFCQYCGKSVGDSNQVSGQGVIRTGQKGSVQSEERAKEPFGIEVFSEEAFVKYLAFWRVLSEILEGKSTLPLRSFLVWSNQWMNPEWEIDYDVLEAIMSIYSINKTEGKELVLSVDIKSFGHINITNPILNAFQHLTDLEKVKITNQVVDYFDDFDEIPHGNYPEQEKVFNKNFESYFSEENIEIGIQVPHRLSQTITQKYTKLLLFINLLRMVELGQLNLSVGVFASWSINWMYPEWLTAYDWDNRLVEISDYDQKSDTNKLFSSFLFSDINKDPELSRLFRGLTADDLGYLKTITREIGMEMNLPEDDQIIDELQIYKQIFREREILVPGT